MTDPLRRLLLAVQRRQRVADAAWGLTRFALPCGLFIATATTFAIRFLDAPPPLLWLTALPMPVVLAWAFVRPRSLRSCARRVDEHFALDDQLGSALELDPKAAHADERTRHIVVLLHEQARARSQGLDPRSVVAIQLSAPRWIDGLAVGLLLLAAAIPAPRPPTLRTWMGEIAVGPAPAIVRKGIDLALAEPLRQTLESLRGLRDPAAAAAAEILALLAELERGEIDRALALAALTEIDRELTEAEETFEAQLAEDPERLAEAMHALADALTEHELTQAVGEALDEGRAEDAQGALNEAAETMEQGSAEDREALRQAMEAAERSLAQAAGDDSSTDAELDEAERRLRREQRQDPQEGREEQERRLKRLQERVEELRRQQEREAAAQRRLEQLRRDADDASRSGSGGKSQRRALEQLSRGVGSAAQQARAAQRMRQARDGLDEAKRFIRRSDKQDDASNRRREQFRRFAKAAQGEPKPKPGEDSATVLMEGEVGDGEPTMMMEGEGPESGQEGEGEPMLGDAGTEQERTPGGGPGDPSPGEGVGEGSSEPLSEAEERKLAVRNVHVDARAGRGVSRAEVIRDSSQAGFASEPYRRVFNDYRAFAQSALDHEALPSAKRQAVKRYYQLIQPRD